MMPRSGRSEDAQRVRRALDDPRRLCAALGLSKGAQRQGRGLVILCPNPTHADRHPSCSVRVAADGTIACVCFSCGWHADALGLIAAARGLDVRRDFRAVLEEGARLASVHVEPAIEPKREPDRPALDADTFDAVAAALIDLAPLDAEPDVLTYLAGRGVLDEARRAGWGALPRPAGQRRIVAELVGRFGLDVLTRSRLGRVTRDGRTVLTFDAHRVVIPWRAWGVAGLVTAVQRRHLGTDGRRYTQAGETESPYGIEDALEELGEKTEILIVEGAIDTLARRAKYRATGTDRVVVGIPGASGWRRSWARLGRGRGVFVGTDADKAGESAAEVIAADIRAAGAVDVERLRPDGAEDWAALAEVAA